MTERADVRDAVRWPDKGGRMVAKIKVGLKNRAAETILKHEGVTRVMGRHGMPTGEQLKRLYEAAIAFKNAQPWERLYDADLICVENPRNKVRGYCSVMGRAGEHYALGVYLGNNGLYGFCHMMGNADSIPKHQILHFQDCIMGSFEDRNTLTERDRKQIKELGLSFRGRNAWPMFRRYEPGYYPWYINEEECIFLTHALEQVPFVNDGISEGRLKMDMNHGKTILRYRESKNGKPKWYSKEVQLPLPEALYEVVEITDDLLIQRVKKSGNMQVCAIQVDIGYMPSPVREDKGERPYFPKFYVVVEPKTGLVMDYKMYQDAENDVDIILDRLISMFLNEGIPEEIQVRNDALIAMLDHFCTKTGIRLKVMKRLSAVERLIEEIATIL